MGRGRLLVRVWEEDTHRLLPGAEVRVWNAGGSLPPATTSGNGTAEVPDLPDGWVGARAQAPGFAASEPRWTDVTADVASVLHIALERGVAVEGVVVTAEDARPVAGAIVLAHRARSLLLGRETPFDAARTGDDGRIRLEAVPFADALGDGAALEATFEGRAVTDVLVAPEPGDAAPVLVRISMPAGATLRGDVRNADGSPAAGVEVTAHPGAVPEELLRFGVLWSPGLDGTVRRPLRTTCGDDGTFAVAGLVAGEAYTLVARGPGGTSSAPCVATAAGDAAPVRLLLRGTGRVRIAVRGPDGGPVGGTTVHVLSRPDAKSEAVETAPGVWVVDGAPEPGVDVFASAPGFLHVLRTVRASHGRTTRTTITLRPTPTVAGVVVDDLGVPVAGARVWTIRVEGVTEECGRNDAVTTGADGRFLADVTDDRRRQHVLAEGPRHARSALRNVRVPATDLRIAVPREAIARARVVAPDGAPLTCEVECALWVPFVASPPRGGRWTFRRVAAEGGAVALDGLPPRRTKCALRAPGRVPVEFEVDGAPGAALDAGTLVLGPAPECVGQVVDSRGVPVEGVPVVAIREPARPFPWEWTPRAVTDRDGRFRLGGLAAGTATLEVGWESPWEDRLRQIAADGTLLPDPAISTFRVDVPATSPHVLRLPDRRTARPPAGAPRRTPPGRRRRK